MHLEPAPLLRVNKANRHLAADFNHMESPGIPTQPADDVIELCEVNI